MPLTMHQKFSEKIVAKNRSRKQDTISSLSCNGQKPLPYDIVINE